MSCLALIRMDLLGKFQSSAPAAELRIAVGDTLQIGVLGATPGLFNQGGGPTAPGVNSNGRPRRRNLLPVTVGRDGAISVPFAGRVQAAGKTVDEVRVEIEHALADKVANPQVQVFTATSANAGANSATVGGEVNKAGVFPLQPSGNRLLDLIAEAGGPRYPAYEITVHLTRNGHVAPRRRCRMLLIIRMKTSSSTRTTIFTCRMILARLRCLVRPPKLGAIPLALNA